MGQPKLSLELAQEAIGFVEQCIKDGYKVGGRPSALMEAAKRLELLPQTFMKRIQMAEEHYGLHLPSDILAPSSIEMPDLPDGDIPIEDIIKLQSERFLRKMESFDKHTWFPIKVKDDLPIGICWFGDPHLDDNGCNWPELERHIKACRETPGLYGANVGDTTNNWIGRLVRLYAEQDTSVHTARRLAEWFLLESGVPWLVVLIGNHDAWGDGAAILMQMAKRYGTHKLILHDWEVRFKLEFPSWSPRIFASHNFKGNSIWNPMHGPMREGQIGEDADLYVCGDKHIAGEFAFENVARGRLQRFVRVRGFKFMDDYARRGGFKEQKQGCSSVTVFDPKRRVVSSFMDVEEGADFLTWKRNRA